MSGQTTPSGTPTDVDTAVVEEPEEQFEFNEEYAELLTYSDVYADDYRYSSPYGWSGVPEGIYDYSLNKIEEDQYGSYKRVKVSLKDEYIDAIPLEYLDITYPNDTRVRPTTETRPIEDISEEDVREALRVYSDFTLNEALDSIALDNPYRYEEWLDTVGGEYFTPMLLRESREGFDPFGYDDYYKTDGGLGQHVWEEHGPPVGWNLMHTQEATPGLVHHSAKERQFMVEWEGEVMYPSWGNTSVPMLRDGGSRSGVRHLFGFNMREVPGSGVHTQIYIESNFHLRSVSDWAVFNEAREGEGEFRAHDINGIIGYTLIKLDGDWKINGFQVKKASWDPKPALGEDAYEKYPKWAESAWLERPELRYPEVTR